MKNCFYIILLNMIMSPLHGQDMQSCYQEGMELYMQNNYNDAFLRFKDCYESDTTDVLSLEKMALCSYRIGVNNRAKQLFEKVIQKDSSSVLSYNILGTIYEQEEHIPKALKYYSRLIELDSLNSVYWKKVANIYFKANLPFEGLTYYLRAHDLNPYDIGIIRSLADFFLNQDSIEIADVFINKGVELDAENIGLVQLAAKSDYKKGDYQACSEKLFSLTRKIDLSAYYNKMLGYSFLQIDSLDKAIFHLEKALVRDRKPESIHYYLGNAYQKKGEMVYAQHHYEKAVDAGISDNIGLYYRQLAALHEKEKAYKNAIQYYKKAYDATGNDELLFMLAMNCDRYYKDKTMAINYFSKYASSEHDNKEYKKYAIERMRYLREIAHFRNN